MTIVLSNDFIVQGEPLVLVGFVVYGDGGRRFRFSALRDTGFVEKDV